MTRSNASRSGTLRDPGEGFFAKLGSYGGPILLGVAAIFTMAWLTESGRPEPVTLSGKALACTDPSGPWDVAVANAGGGALATFGAMVAGGCTILNPGDKVMYIERGGLLWLRAKIRYENKIYYASADLID